MPDHSPVSYMLGARAAIRAGNLTDALTHLDKALDVLHDDEPAEDPRPDALTEADRTNFHTLVEAFSNDDAVLMHAREKTTGHGVALLCIASAVPGSEETDLIPVARMLDRSATLDYDDPTEG